MTLAVWPGVVDSEVVHVCGSLDGVGVVCDEVVEWSTVVSVEIWVVSV